MKVYRYTIDSVGGIVTTVETKDRISADNFCNGEILTINNDIDGTVLIRVWEGEEDG